ncbi:MAG: VWA domain-containing protein [Deltaproteobacteria bacterium]|nr:VWA domain-containing protein [Deltaproteobacteria bacterium]
MTTSSSDPDPILRRAVLPAPRSGRKRLAIFAASLGALGLASGLGFGLLGRQASARVDINIATPAPPPPPQTPIVEPAKPTPRNPGRIQVALMLDTSGSMGGLIEQARSQLWKIVTRLDAARRDGQRPQLEIALYEYGNPNRATEKSGWIRQIKPFTTDLDSVSEALFSLSVGGGDEYVGKAVATAIRDLEWSTRDGDLKLLFIAGNEDFDMGPVSPKKAMTAAKEKGVNVTAILCGDNDPTWSNGSKLASMGFFTIDQNQVVAHVDAPQDAEITRLGELLNATYIPFGAEGADGVARQLAQDGNAINSQPGSMVWRSMAKSSGNYTNSTWDLGDRFRAGGVELEKIANADLPPAMRGLLPEQRRAYVEGKLAERAQIQTRIQQLGNERTKFVAAAQGKSAGAQSLDTAMLTALSTQARAVGLQLE